MIRNDDLFAAFQKFVEEHFPQSAAVRVLQSILLIAWCRETSHPHFQALWTPLSPAIGQADITAMAVQNMMGGSISEMDLASGQVHYYNRVSENGIIMTVDIARPELPEKRKNTRYTSYRSMLTGWQSARARRGERYDLLKSIIRARLMAGP